jgi:predicted metal-dependent hydrolase
MKLDWSCGALADGLQCYRSEEFFLAHEHWESVWLKCQEPEKTFLQALIQVTAAFHHLQRNNSRGTASLLRAALRRLEPFPDFFEGIAVTQLRQEVGMWLQRLEVQDVRFHLPFPQIRLGSPSNEHS